MPGADSLPGEKSPADPGERRRPSSPPRAPPDVDALGVRRSRNIPAVPSVISQAGPVFPPQAFLSSSDLKQLLQQTEEHLSLGEAAGVASQVGLQPQSQAKGYLARVSSAPLPELA